VNSRRTPDARITGGFWGILENSGKNAKTLLGGLGARLPRASEPADTGRGPTKVMIALSIACSGRGTQRLGRSFGESVLDGNQPGGFRGTC